MTGFRVGLSLLHAARFRRALLASVLGDLYLSANSLAEDAAQGAVVGTVLGLRQGSTWDVQNSAGSRFVKSGNTVVRGATALDYATATDFGNGLRGHDIVLRETNPSFDNSPKDTTVRIFVSAVGATATINNTLGSANLTGNQVQGFAAEATELDADLDAILTRLVTLENA